MLTLQELKRITAQAEDSWKPPTAKQLRESGRVIVQKQLGQGAEIFVYQNGCVLYQVENHSTVFFLHSCQDYFYILDGKTVCLPEQYFDRKSWYLRLVLEGEDRLSRNLEERERNWNISYDAISENMIAMENLTKSMTEYVVRKEMVEQLFQNLTKKQRCVIQKYYLQEKTQRQISKELGISQQAVSAMISQAICNIQKKYQVYQNHPNSRVHGWKGEL